jgi:hypothetical protein
MIAFEPNPLPKDDENGLRTCGCCGIPKAKEEFYRDGTDGNGNPKYRRDCKECYRVTRLSSRQKKRTPAPAPKRRGKR